MGCDILLTGTGLFAARIAFDLAATSTDALRVVIAGRNAARRDWLVTAANARAKIFGSPARFAGAEVDLRAPDAADALLARDAPRVIVQAASAQPSAVIATGGDAWSRLVAEGGLSATALTQAQFSLAMARANSRAGDRAALINCAFPDVVNSLIVAAGHRVLCGMGNVGILSGVFAGEADLLPGRLKVLAHYQTLAAFRRPASDRAGRPPRVWIDGREVEDVFARFRSVKLTPEPVIDISGATGVPLIQALCGGRDWSGHLPGPHGLPGGYPVALVGGALDLALPPGLTREAAISWNAAFEQENGLSADATGRLRFNGTLRALLARHLPDLAEGFDVDEIDAAAERMNALRRRLQETPA